ncbi:MAG TPA: hypothetical protein VKY65_12485 [Alphaproteobacteria bacterium]|nr:hypothetical protein [Alphaproteobacteria bacterium]
MTTSGALSIGPGILVKPVENQLIAVALRFSGVIQAKTIDGIFGGAFGPGRDLEKDRPLHIMLLTVFLGG